MKKVEADMFDQEANEYLKDGYTVLNDWVGAKLGYRHQLNPAI